MTTTHTLSPITDKQRKRAEEYLMRSGSRMRTLAFALDGESLTDAARRYLRSIQPTGNENVDLLADCLAYAEVEKRLARTQRRASRFNMHSWTGGGVIAKRADGGPPPMACGTTACLAGTAAAFTLADNEVLDGADVRVLAEYEIEPYRNGTRTRFVAWAMAPGVYLDSVEARGQEVLGLSAAQKAILFYLTEATLGNIKLVASYMTGYDLNGVGL